MADSIYYELSRYTQLPIIILGTMGAIVNQILFYYRKPLRATSCSLYFRALSINDLLVLYVYVLLQWLVDQYNIDPTQHYTWYCKGKTYIHTCLYTISPYLVVLACFDRLCTSSTNVRLRRVASIRIASYLIPCTTILIVLAYCHMPFYYVIYNSPTVSVCTIIDQRYNEIFAIFLVVFLGFLPPVLMIILCSVTLILLRQQRRRVMPINQSRLRQRDNQLLKMLFIYVVSHSICTLPFSVVLIIAVYQLPTPSPTILDLFRIFVLLFNVNFATSFYIYTLGTPFYRHEFVGLVKETYTQILRILHINPNRPRQNITVNPVVKRT